MRAADVAETVPTASPDDDLLTAIRKVAAQRLPALVIADDRGVVDCISSVDLLQAALPRYFLEDRNLVRVVDEASADRIVAKLVGVRVADIVGKFSVPMAAPRATMVELAELMVDRRCALVLVTKEDGGTLGVVTANRLLELLAAAAEEPPR